MSLRSSAGGPHEDGLEDRSRGGTTPRCARTREHKLSLGNAHGLSVGCLRWSLHVRGLACAGECPRLARGIVTFFAGVGRGPSNERETPTDKPWASWDERLAGDVAASVRLPWASRGRPRPLRNDGRWRAVTAGKGTPPGGQKGTGVITGRTWIRLRLHAPRKDPRLFFPGEEKGTEVITGRTRIRLRLHAPRKDPRLFFPATGRISSHHLAHTLLMSTRVDVTATIARQASGPLGSRG